LKRPESGRGDMPSVDVLVIVDIVDAVKGSSGSSEMGRRARTGEGDRGGDGERGKGSVGEASGPSVIIGAASKEGAAVEPWLESDVKVVRFVHVVAMLSRGGTVNDNGEGEDDKNCEGGDDVRFWESKRGAPLWDADG
jgi:hypothetical protein